jgi:O-antigen ligase
MLVGGSAQAARASSVLPAGVLQPLSGVYAAEDEAGCCWLAPSARFTIDRPSHTDVITLDFVIPPYAAARKKTGLIISSGGASRRFCCFGAGEHSASLHLKGRSGPAVLEVSVVSTTRFVPAELGLNQDRRELSVLLKHVSTTDSSTGEIYMGATPMSSNMLLPRWRVIADAICLAIAAVLLPFLFRRPKYAWVAILIAAPFLFPVPVGGTTISLEKVVLVLAAAIMMFHAKFRAAIFGGPGIWILGALLLFAADMLLSSTAATFPGAALRETLKAAEYALVFAVVYGAYRTDPDESLLRSTVAWVICIVSILALLQPFVEPVQRTILMGEIVPRLAGPLEGPNQLAAFLGIMMVALIALSPRLSPATIFALVLGTLALVLTISRAGFVAFVLGAATVLAVKLWPRHRKSILLSAAVICAAVLIVTAIAAVTFPNAHLDRLFGVSDAYNGGLGSRAGLWHAAIVLWHGHPLLGVGPGNYELQVGSILPGVRTHPNGYFFQVLAEQGIAGLVILAAVILVPAFVFARNLESRFAAAGIGVILTLNFHQLVDGLVLYPKVGLEYWALVALAAAAVTRKAANRTAPVTADG